jgi:hypothetical protein
VPLVPSLHELGDLNMKTQGNDMGELKDMMLNFLSKA